MSQTQADRSWWQTLWARTKDRVTGVELEPPEGAVDLHRQALASTRGRVIAEALIVLIAGFTLDDLGLLRFPGYIAGIALAVVILSVGGLYHASRIAGHLAHLDREEQAGRLEAIQARSRLAAVIAGVGFLAWMVIFSLGVPPWAL